MIEEPSDEFCRAYTALWHAESNTDHRPDRNAVEATLKRFSDGSTDSEDLCFMRELARCLLSAGSGKNINKDRADKILKASGLSGTYDNHREFVQHATLFQGFDGYTIAGGIKGAQSAGLSSSISIQTAIKIIARARQKSEVI